MDGAHASPSSGGTILIFGATSPVMRALTREYAAERRPLVLVGREAAELDSIAADLRVRYGSRVDVRVLDVLEVAAGSQSVEALLAEVGNDLAGAVVAVGHLGPSQAEASRDWREAKRILEVNFVGCVAVLEPLARRLEEIGSGFIAVLSSVAGDRGRQSNYLYGASKAGLSAYLSGLRNRLFRAGVHVVTVKPGFVDTPMTYGKPGVFLVASPSSVARGIRIAVEKRRDVVYLPWFWRWIMLVIRAIPERIFKRLRL